MARAKRRLHRRVSYLLAGIYRAPLNKTARAMPDGLAVHLASADELRAIATRPEWDMRPEFVEQALVRGDQCVVSYYHGELVSYGWAGYGRTPHIDNIFIEFAAGHRYNFKAYTAPAFRGRHLRGSFGTLEVADKSRGATHSIAFVDVRNHASVQAEKRNGGRLVGYAGYIASADHFIAFTTPGARKFGFKFIRVRRGA